MKEAESGRKGVRTGIKWALRSDTKGEIAMKQLHPPPTQCFVSHHHLSPSHHQAQTLVCSSLNVLPHCGVKHHLCAFASSSLQRYFQILVLLWESTNGSAILFDKKYTTAYIYLFTFKLDFLPTSFVKALLLSWFQASGELWVISFLKMIF